MNIVITGGAGFLGQQLVAKMLVTGSNSNPSIDVDGKKQAIGKIICFDQSEGQLKHPTVSYITGDISNATTVHALIDSSVGLVIHLAAVVSGTAEANFPLGMQVNLDGTRHVLEACRSAGRCPRLLFASSVATFGGDLPKVVTDATTPTPQGSYGIQKLLGELLVQDYSRKGYVDGRSVRVPTVVVRPGKPNGAASSFASGMVREPLQGQSSVIPVSMDTELWVIAVNDLLENLLHAIDLPQSSWGLIRSVNLPGMTVSVNEAMAALTAVGGASARALVTQATDPAIARIVNSWPARFDTARANDLGFVVKRDFTQAVRDFSLTL